MRNIILEVLPLSLVSIAAAVLLAPARLAAQETLVLAPEQLVGVISKGQKIKLVLRSGTYAEARLEEPGSAALRVNVSKTHDPRDLSLGRQDLPLDRLASVSVPVRKGGKRWKLPLALCSTLGTVSILLAGATE